jgi:hypothetical protein
MIGMPDRYIVKAGSLPQWPCASEQDAMQKAGELFDEHGSSLQVEILLNDATLYGAKWMANWNQRRKT